MIIIFFKIHNVQLLDLKHMCTITDLMVLKLIPSEGSYTGFDASCPQSNEQQPHHGQSTEMKPNWNYTLYVQN